MVKVSFFNHLSAGKASSNPGEKMGALLLCLLRVLYVAPSAVS
jgi:hypothetical protein